MNPLGCERKALSLMLCCSALLRLLIKLFLVPFRVVHGAKVLDVETLQLKLSQRKPSCQWIAFFSWQPMMALAHVGLADILLVFL